jgi:hypothetical protein
LLFMNSSGDMMAFRLQDSSFHYEIRLEGNAVNNVQSFQGCLVSSNNAHLCLLDTAKNLSYFHWKGVKWQRICTWQQVAPSFQSALDPSGIFHLIIPSPEGNRLFSFPGQEEQEADLHFLEPDSLLLQLYAVNQDNLLLLRKEITESACFITYYIYNSPSHTWSEKIPVANLPLDCQDLQFFFSQGVIHLTYFTPDGNKKLLNLLSINAGSGEIVEHCLGKLSSSVMPPVMSTLDDDIVVLVLEPNNLIYWRSGDQGQTWTTKGELPCPWPLKLAPVINPQKEITDYIALEGFFGLELSRPGLLTTRELLSLSPYGLWI